jgi:hypothetical protein
MHCIFCYNNHVNASSPIIHAKKRFNFILKTNGIITFTKHVDANNAIIAKKLKMKSIIQ